MDSRECPRGTERAENAVCACLVAGRLAAPVPEPTSTGERMGVRGGRLRILAVGAGKAGKGSARGRATQQLFGSYSRSVYVLLKSVFFEVSHYAPQRGANAAPVRLQLGVAQNPAHPTLAVTASTTHIGKYRMAALHDLRIRVYKPRVRRGHLHGKERPSQGP